MGFGGAYRCANPNPNQVVTGDFRRVMLISVDQAKFTRSHTISQIQPKSLPFVRICHIDSPIHISRDLEG